MNILKGENREVLLLLILTSAFLLLTLTVTSGYTQPIDEEITRTLSERSEGVIFKSMTFLTYMGHYYFLVPGTIMVVLLFYRVDEKLLSTFFGGMMLLLIPAYKVVKFLIKRPRPGLGLFHSTGYSYPSGHTVGAFTFFLGFYVFYQLLHRDEHDPHLLLICAALATTVGISRIILGVHYLTDVIGGILLSGILITTLSMVIQKTKNCSDDFLKKFNISSKDI